MSINISPSNFLMKYIRQYFAIKKLYYTVFVKNFIKCDRACKNQPSSRIKISLICLHNL